MTSYRLLIGGSPCTHWSIAQSKNRETTASGEGWELFWNYKIAKEKFQPHGFLYENNKSIDKVIKAQINKELGGAQQEINSALVSAQLRARIYQHSGGYIPLPEDRGILLKDVLESGCAPKDKSNTMTAHTSSMSPADIVHCLNRAQRMFVAEPVTWLDKAYTLDSNYWKTPGPYMPENQSGRRQMVAHRIGTVENAGKPEHDSQQYRVYSPEAKAVTLNANGGGLGAKTGLYAVPLNINPSGKGMNGRVMLPDHKAYTLTTNKGEGGKIIEPAIINTPHGYNNGGIKYDKAPTMTSSAWQENNQILEAVHEYMIKNPQKGHIYEVKNGKITIKGGVYDIRLPDGFYIIRKLSVVECCRLQTLPDNYFFYPDGTKIVSDTQAYKALGNGWTAEVVIHLLSYILNGEPKDRPMEVLSMYDGIGTGRYCLDKMGFTNVTYYAYEIDKYAIKVASANYPDIIQCGNAFDVRRPDWSLTRNYSYVYAYPAQDVKQLTIEDFMEVL